MCHHGKGRNKKKKCLYKPHHRPLRPAPPNQKEGLYFCRDVFINGSFHSLLPVKSIKQQMGFKVHGLQKYVPSVYVQRILRQMIFLLLKLF